MSAASRETRWSLVTRAQGDTPEARTALSELCEIYYLPVLNFVKHRSSTDVSRDLTHAFFESILSGDSLNGACRERGRFRNYLLGAVKHFLYETEAKEKRLKRGGQFEHVPAATDTMSAPSSPSPDAEFDRAWACAILDRSLNRLSGEMKIAGKHSTFLRLHPWLAGTAEHGSQSEVAAELGVSETAIRVQVHRLRKRFREIVESEVRQTLEPGDDVEEELRHLLAVW